MTNITTIIQKFYTGPCNFENIFFLKFLKTIAYSQKKEIPVPDIAHSSATLYNTV